MIPLRLVLLVVTALPAAAAVAGVEAAGASAAGGQLSMRASRPVATIRGVDNSFGSISCASATFCEAVVQTAGDTRAFAMRWDGRRWGSPSLVGSGDQINPDFHVSCASPRFCEAVDVNGDAARYDGRRWFAQGYIPGIGGTTDTAVSCASPSFCETVSTAGWSSTWNGRRWTPATPAGPLETTTMSAVSCPVASHCLAIGPGQQGGGAAWVYLGRWGEARVFAAPGNPDSVSCPTESLCFAADDRGGVERWLRGGWSRPAQVGSSHDRISCASAAFCVVDDSAAVRVWNGQRWGGPERLPTGASVAGLSCARARFCAVFSGGELMTLRWLEQR